MQTLKLDSDEITVETFPMALDAPETPAAIPNTREPGCTTDVCRLVFQD